MTMTKEEKDARKQVFACAKRHLGAFYNSTLVGKQTTKYMNEGRTAAEICATLDYFYDVRKNDPQLSRGGIGIVPYVSQEAADYYSRLKNLETQVERRADGADAEAAANAEPKTVFVRRQPIRRPRSWNSFDLD